MRYQHRLVYLDEDEALDAQTNLQHEKYGFADAADLEKVDEKFQVTFLTERQLKASERQLVVNEELPDGVGFNEEASEEENQV